MSIESLPTKILIEIVQYLPFKEQIRIARVSKLFHEISKLAILEMKELQINDDLVRYAKSIGLENFRTDFLRFISQKVRGMVVKWSKKNMNMVDVNCFIRVILLNYTFPRVVYIQLDLPNNVGYRGFGLTEWCPNLKFLVYICCASNVSLPTRKIDSLQKFRLDSEESNLLTIDYKLRELIFDASLFKTNNSISAIMNLTPPGLKKIRLNNLTEHSAAFDKLLGKNPNLESIDISSSNRRNLETLLSSSNFRRLSALKNLGLSNVQIVMPSSEKLLLVIFKMWKRFVSSECSRSRTILLKRYPI